jgi:ectoine hydroxylase-related dioxygenase (phytanoyl-CoA dioxygenase family)
LIALVSPDGCTRVIGLDKEVAMSNRAQLPDLETEFVVTPDQANAYRANGHVLLRAVCAPEEVVAYRSVLSDATYRFKTEQRPLDERDTYGRAFLQVTNLWTRDEAARRFVLARRFGKIAADLMGVAGVRIYHDQALYNEAHGGRTPWHQDQYYWPLDSDHSITMWMPLMDADEQMGTMTFASGSHKEGFLGHIEISDRSDEVFRKLVADKGFALSSAGPMKAGDATFHSGWTLHSAPGNATDRCREVMTVIYFADGTRIAEPDNKHRVDDLRAWFPGQTPGELAAGSLNPLVYP